MIVNTQFHKKIVRACSMFCPYERYRSVTPLDDLQEKEKVGVVVYTEVSVECTHSRLKSSPDRLSCFLLGISRCPVLLPR